MIELPPLSPERQAKIDQFYAGSIEMLDRYIAVVELDMNRHAVKHGQMPIERMVYDLTRIMVAQIHDENSPLTVEGVVGMLTVAISRGITAKRKGRG
jgi:hypothetical protein